MAYSWNEKRYVVYSQAEGDKLKKDLEAIGREEGYAAERAAYNAEKQAKINAMNAKKAENAKRREASGRRKTILAGENKPGANRR